jgi:hypothetical protein
MRPQPRRQLSTGLGAARVRAGGQLVFWGDVHILGPEHVQLRARRVWILRDEPDGQYRKNKNGR